MRFCDGYFIIPIISLNKFFYNNIILLVLLKKIRIYTIFVILLILLKNINLVCWVYYNLKFTNIYNYNVIQNKNNYNVIQNKKISYKMTFIIYTLSATNTAERRTHNLHMLPQ
jgi:hypothetical protein